ncbi:MAG: ABC transporter permease [Clostridium sp.]|nr:ABC transporter permease [Clostridium sp.]MCM1172564.1 ABC transporter permease [Clostridium sp.]
MKHNKKINIVHHVTKKYMRINKKRTFTALIGITFMVLLMTCVFVGKDTAIKYLEDLSSMKQGKWHAVVYDTTKDKMEQLQGMDMVESTVASASLGLTDFSYSENTERPYLNIKAYEKDCFDLYNIKLAKGRLPENSDEIVLSYACVSDGAELEIGDKIDAEYFNRTITGKQQDGAEGSIFPFYELEIKNGETVTPPQDFFYLGDDDNFQENKEYLGESVTYTVVGFMEIPFYEKEEAAAYTGITLLDDKLFAVSDLLNVSLLFDLEYKNYDSIESHAAIEAIVGKGKVEFNNYLLTFSGNSSDTTMNMLVNMMTVFFVALIILASVLLIYNVFNMSFRERCRYLGMLSSVGATARQKKSSIYYEAFSLLIPAIPIGIGLGFGVVLGGMNLLKPFILKFMSFLGLAHTLPVTLMVSGRAIAVIIIISVLTVLVSAFLPAKKIAKIGAVESIRNGDSNKNKTYKMKNNSIKIFGAEGLLAGNSLKRQRRKKKSISLAVVIFMVILLVTAFGTGAIHRVADDRTRESATFNLKENQGMIALSPNYISEDMSKEEYEEGRKEYDALKEELRGTKGVLSVEERYDETMFGSVSADTLSREYWDAYYAVLNEYYDGALPMSEFESEYKPLAFNSVSVLAVNNDTLRDIADKTGSDYEVLVNPQTPSAIIINECAISTDHYSVYGKTPKRYRYYDIEAVTDLKQGDHFDLDVYSPKEEAEIPFDFQIAGFAKNEQLADYLSVYEDIWIIISIDTAKEIATALGYYDVGQIFSESAVITVDKDSMDIFERLKTFSDGDSEMFFADKDFLEMQMTMSQAMVKIIDIMLICFVLLTSVICLLNLGNSISGRMEDRRREFAVMQSIGMTRPQMRKMLLMECMGILAEGLVIALVISFLLMYFIKRTIISIFGNVALTLPVALMVFAVLFTAFAVVIITMLSFGREKKQNLLESIRSESV